MPTYVNPFRGTDPTASAFADFGKAAFGDTGAGALRKQQIIAAQRENDETNRLATLLKDDPNGAAGKRSPLVDAVLLASGYKPEDFNKLALGSAASQFGAQDQRTQDAQVGAGQSYDNTFDAFSTKANETAREFDMKPVTAINGEGQAVFGRQGDLSGLFPALSDSEQKGRLIGNNFDNLDALSDPQLRVLGAAPKGASETPKNYVAGNKTFITYDGKTDAQTGQPLPAGGYIATAQGSASDVGLVNSVKGNLQSEIQANTKFINLSQAAIDLAQKHPDAFGPIGAARGAGQEVGQTAATLFNSLGGEDALANVRAGIASAGLDQFLPNLYDPNLPKAESLGYLLIYQGASALAAQSGRSVSDKDIETWSHIIGDPQALLGSANNFITKLQLVQAIAQSNLNTAQASLQGGEAGKGDGAALSHAVEAAGSADAGTDNFVTPGAAPADEVQDGATATGPNGEKIVLRNGAWVPL